jgi:RNA polymerase sigma factor (sigma-70 family)
MSATDRELLSEYAAAGSGRAFATLVERHLDLVYSAARRQVRSAALAEEVAQSVFIDLARRAGSIPDATPLVAWLHVVSRRTAIDVIRRESRRLSREQEAAALGETMKSNPPAWDGIEPLLDEAVESLDAADRAAILLRYFENKSLREVGAALGTSEDTAQKRVSRAVDELRRFLLRRGVAVSAAGLSADLSAHALLPAPAGLGATIANAATLTGVAAAATLKTSSAIVMTTLQKTAVVAAFVIVAGAGIYQAKVADRRADELRALHAQTDRTTEEIRAVRSARTVALARLKSVEEQIDARLASVRASSVRDAALETEMKDWLGRVDRLKRFFVERPEQSIPELQTLTDVAWFNAASEPIDSAEALRRTTSQLRHLAAMPFTRVLHAALRAYLPAHNDILPASPHDLAPYCEPPMDPAILDRYAMLQTGKLADVPAAERRNILSLRTPIDPEFDSLPTVSPTSYGSTSALGVNFTHAMRGFAEANPGIRPMTAAQLRPYLKWPLRDEAVQRILDRSAPKAP